MCCFLLPHSTFFVGLSMEGVEVLSGEVAGRREVAGHRACQLARGEEGGGRMGGSSTVDHLFFTTPCFYNTFFYNTFSLQHFFLNFKFQISYISTIPYLFKFQISKFKFLIYLLFLIYSNFIINNIFLFSFSEPFRNQKESTITITTTTFYYYRTRPP